jgi:hypothetical protein
MKIISSNLNEACSQQMRFYFPPFGFSYVTKKYFSMTEENYSVTQRTLCMTKRNSSTTQDFPGMIQENSFITHGVLKMTQENYSVMQRVLKMTQRNSLMTDKYFSMTQEVVFLTDNKSYTSNRPRWACFHHIYIQNSYCYEKVLSAGRRPR